MVRDHLCCCNRSLDNHYSLCWKCKQLLFPLDLDSPIFLLGHSILGMDFWVKPPKFGLPMSIQSVALETVHAWATWPSRVLRITSLVTHFLATKKNYSVHFQFVMMLVIFAAWSPKNWSESGWQNHLFVSFFQVSTSEFECLATHSFSICLFLHWNDFFYDSFYLEKDGLNWTCDGFLSTES